MDVFEDGPPVEQACLRACDLLSSLFDVVCALHFITLRYFPVTMLSENSAGGSDNRIHYLTLIYAVFWLSFCKSDIRMTSAPLYTGFFRLI